MDRRRFLKYSGATAALVGASVLGIEYFAWGPRTVNPSHTTMSSQLMTSFASSSISTQLASLEGRLFFDYNGNGVQDEEDPVVAGALVQLNDNVGKAIAETVTDSSGEYKLGDVRTGSYRLHLGVEHFRDKRLRYMCTSAEEATEIARGYNVTLGEPSNQMNIGLMEGFLTLPLSSNTEYSIGEKIGGFYDWDPAAGNVKWWNEKSFPYRNKAGVGAQDNHTGTDLDAREGPQVVAPAPGMILSAGIGPNPESFAIDIQHDIGFKTSYNHLSRTLVSAGQRVSRGQAIGLVGSTGTFYPHLHFELYQSWSGGPVIFDPYRPAFTIAEDRSGCWALKEREQYWLHLLPTENPNLLNYWTKDNNPQYSMT